MSGSDALDLDVPDALDLDHDPEEFPSEEAFRDYVDAQLADLRDRLDAQDARDDALSRQVSTLREEVEDAKQRAERAELVASWGGIGYRDRLATVVRTLINRAEHGSTDESAAISTVEQVREDHMANRYTRPGVYDLFDGSVSKRTCRSYISDLAECPGFSTASSERGGYGGGSDAKRLRFDLSTFRDHYGEDWAIDDLIADIRGGDDNE